MNFYEFAGAHPFLTVTLAVLLLSFPVAVIKALKNKSDD